MANIGVRDIVDNFKRAMLVDFENKSIWIMKDGQLKIYSELFYNQLVELLRSSKGMNIPFED